MREFTEALESSSTSRHEEERGHARNQQLTEIASLLTATFDIDQILSTLMGSALAMAEAEVGALMLLEDGMHAAVTWGLEEDVIRGILLDSGETAPEHVTRSGELFWSPDCQADPRVSRLPSQVSVESLLCVPLRNKGRALGCIVIVNRPSPELPSEDRESLKALAAFATVALENARLHQVALEKQALERELGIARQVQLALLPAGDPDWPGLEWASAYVPMGKVGGDYYDYVKGPGGRMGVVVADVSDKGVPAALFMAATRNMLRHEATQNTDPAVVVRGVNLTLCEDTERFASMFVTMFYGIYEPASHCFRYANAGHCPALWVPAKGSPAWITSEGTVLGQFQDAVYVSGEVTLSQGDLLVLYTDGVTEADSRDQGMFRREGLLATVLECRMLPPRELAGKIVQSVREFSGDCGAADDLTVLVGKVK